VPDRRKKPTARPRPYTRCQECGAAFKGSRVHPFCGDCSDGQTTMFDRPLAPAGFAPVWRGSVFVVERLFWRGRPLWIGLVHWRWLLPASRVGYPYPGKDEPDVIDRPADDVTLPDTDDRAAA